MPTAKAPAAFAMATSSGLSPTYAVSAGATPSRPSATRSGSGSGLRRSVSPPHTTAPKNRSRPSAWISRRTRVPSPLETRPCARPAPASRSIVSRAPGTRRLGSVS